MPAKSAYRFPPAVAVTVEAKFAEVAATVAAALFLRASSSFWIWAKVFFAPLTGVVAVGLPFAGFDHGEEPVVAGTAGDILLAQLADDGRPGAGATG